MAKYKDMQDNEIIKCLECCVKSKCTGDCIELDCPALDKIFPQCRFVDRDEEQLQMVLDFINRLNTKNDDLQDEIKRLKETTEHLNGEYIALQNESDIQKAEIERLKGYNENLLSANTALSNEVLETKSEAIKEFAERLKKLSRFTNSDKLYIDNLVKEMVGENNA